MPAKRILLLAGDYVENYEGNLVSAPAWPEHSAWLAQFLTLLGTRIDL